MEEKIQSIRFSKGRVAFDVLDFAFQWTFGNIVVYHCITSDELYLVQCCIFTSKNTTHFRRDIGENTVERKNLAKVFILGRSRNDCGFLCDLSKWKD